MNWKQIIQVTRWAVFSVCVSAFVSLIGFIFLGLRTMDIHKNSSAPGDFAETEASIILSDILVNWGITFPFLCFIAWVGYQITQDLVKEFSTPFDSHQASKFLYGLFGFNLALLCAGPVIGGILYW